MQTLKEDLFFFSFWIIAFFIIATIEKWHIYFNLISIYKPLYKG